MNYYFGSIIGLAPQIFIWTSLGNGFEKIIDKNLEAPSLKELILSSEIYLPILGFIILLLLAIILRKKLYNNQ